MDELVGQLIWAFVGSAEDLETVERAIAKGRVGGVWLLPTEMEGPAETARLINRLQSVAQVPLLVGVDAEAGLGLVMRGATLLPTAMALGATGDPELVSAAATLTASEAAACGINAVAAPVLDVNVNPDNPIINTRAYGESPELVSRMGVAFMDGMSNAVGGWPKVAPIGKHFPGHGDTVHDSHLQLGVVDQPLDRLMEVELPPFRAAIESGIPMLMTAHVAYPALDPDPATPATLSRPIMSDLLRGQLGFQGAVVTDCMNMHAIAHHTEAGEAAVRAVSAGCDLILTEQWDVAYEALMHAILEDRLRGSNIREAAQRVRAVKAQIFGPGTAAPKPIDPEAAAAEVGKRENLELANRIAEASVAVVSGRIPSPRGRPLIIATLMARRFGPSVETQIRSALAGNGRDDIDILLVNPSPEAADINQAVEHARTAGWVALLHFNRVESFDPEAVQAKRELVSLAQSVAATGTPLTVVSLGSPYVLSSFDMAAARVCSFSTSDASVQATLRVLLGGQKPVGRVPVAVA